MAGWDKRMHVIEVVALVVRCWTCYELVAALCARLAVVV